MIAGIFACHARKRSKAGTGRVRHELTASAPNQVWLTDISEHPAKEGKLYLCAVKQCFSNKIVGYSIDSRMKSSLAAAALRNAIALRCPADTTYHSDRGSQFRLKKVARILKNKGLKGSMGRLGSSGEWDVAYSPEAGTPRAINSRA